MAGCQEDGVGQVITNYEQGQILVSALLISHETIINSELRMIDKTILHYKIIEKLGEGGMGVVYLAKDIKLKRQVAIKFLPDHFALDSAERKRFNIEAQAAAALNHSNIATIYAIEEVDEKIFIVMEYIEGQDLKSILDLKHSNNSSHTIPSNVETERKQTLSIDTMLDYATQIAQGLHAAHEKGIVHRDIKSSNIMITADSRVKIMDFGLARVGAGSQITKDHSRLGTAAYMSPEQVRGEVVDYRSDIWSFGVILYEMFTGQLPFKADYEQIVIYAILKYDHVPPKDLNPELNDKLIAIINHALEKDIEDRYASVLELQTDLEDVRKMMSSEINPLASYFTFSQIVHNPRIFLPAIIVIIFLVVLIFWWYWRDEKETWARQKIIPEIERIINDRINAWEAFQLAKQVEPYLADDPVFKKQINRFSRNIKFYSNPSGAQVYVKAYAKIAEDWQFMGQTPIDSIRLPNGISRVKFEKAGFYTGYDLVWNSSRFNDTIRCTLSKKGMIPDDMVLVPEHSNWYRIPEVAGLFMPGLEHLELIHIGDFLMDRYEVTNSGYKRFVDAGGYQDPKYWIYPFIDNMKELSWQDVINQFVDKTGRPGPATWEVGDYPQGRDDFPVSGISWFEAAAYAEFIGKKLPTLYHWDRVALTRAGSSIVPLSNMVNGAGPAEVGAFNSLNRFGVFDLAGNVREWCYTETDQGRKFTLGGAWNDPAYAFIEPYALSPFDRSELNGFRCIQYLDPKYDRSLVEKTISRPFRYYYNEKKVSDETFALFLKQYNYDKTKLNATIESEQESEDWIRQKITFDAVYGNERMLAYLFLPTNASPPYQTVVYFPGSFAMHQQSSEGLGLGPRKFILKSGRALMHPIYKSTFERGDDLHSDFPEETNFWKEHVIMWAKDLSRSVDYLESLEDIDSDRLAYYGLSWGSAIASTMLAVERRFVTSILVVAGLNFQRALPEVDEIHYVSRITTPVLMLNGKYDNYYPYETSQLPFFELLGTPEEDKKLSLFERGHSVPKTQLAKESLNWLDKYLGPIPK